MHRVPVACFLIVFRCLPVEDLLNFCAAAHRFAEQFSSAPGAYELVRSFEMPTNALRNVLRIWPAGAAELIWRVYKCDPVFHSAYGWQTSRGLAPHDIGGCIEPALRYACERGDLAKARWLAARFRLEPRHARAGANYLLRTACGGGRRDVAAWLIRAFGLTANDVNTCDNDAFRRACWGGHLDVVRLIAPWLDHNAVSDRSYAALKSVCERGRLELLRWAVERFGAELGIQDCVLLRRACANGHLEVAQWLAERCAPLYTTIYMQHGGALAQARKYGHTHVAEWLEARFPAPMQT
jgi:hypothetical protein